MKPKPWMYLAAVLAALWFLSRKKPAVPGTGKETKIQQQNLYIDP